MDKTILFSPLASMDTYLINNCGEIINSWNSQFRGGMTAYLDKDGNLYRGGKLNSSVFLAGGLGGVIEKFSWDGDLIWSYALANDSLHLHHDFYVMENENLLLIAWEFIDELKLGQLGRTGIVPGQKFYSERIIEIDPSKDFEVVWQWRAIDHCFQGIDSNIPNYMDRKDALRKLDINLTRSDVGPFLDWLHINSVELDSENNTLLLSCNAIDELVVIEKTNDSQTASSDQGGAYAYGGDLLFRWGRAANFLDENLPKMLFKQHDINIVDDNNGNFAFSVFNNFRPGNNGSFSSVELIRFDSAFEDLIDQTGNTNIQATQPAHFYNNDGMQDLFSKRMSSALFMDDHWLVCASDNGRIFELDENDKIVWEYINPVGSNNTIFEQDQTPFGNTLFNATPYSYDFFEAGLDLEITQGFIQANPVSCSDFISDISYMAPNSNDRPYKLRIESGTLIISSDDLLTVRIIDLQGKVLSNTQQKQNDFCMYTDGFRSQMVIVEITDVVKGSRFIEKLFLGH